MIHRVVLVVLASLFLIPAALEAQNDKRQQRRRRREPLVIPEVTRDKVICFALYTVHESVLKLTAQFYPLQEGESRKARLEVKADGAWKQIAEVDIIERGWTAPFRVEKWDSTKRVEYRVRHGEKASYGGIVRKDPVDKEEIVVAAFTGNSNSDRGPRADILENVKKHDADLLFFSGDQVYDHGKHYPAWLLFGRQFGDIIKDRPTITIPDDHDVGQGNIWGQGGRKSRTGAGHDGGYFYPPEFVNEVQRAQTSHLPDPFDPRPIEQGITVYYTDLTWGRVSFAILEDRKFKTGPEGVVPKMGPRPDHVNDPDYDPRSVDIPEAKLLGDRQLAFLDHWVGDWDGADFKVALSQTIFANAAHIHGRLGGRLLADLDSNGWPQSGRNRALRVLRKGHAFMLAGDQHLATVIHHGVNQWNDSGWSFCVPSIVNYYNRWWWPLMPGKNRKPSPLEHTGEFVDGFGNKLTMYAYANPSPENRRAAGHGIVRFNKKTRKITIECWPRGVDVSAPGAKQFPGWPVTVDQADNYPRKAVAWLPTLEIGGLQDPVVKIVDDESGSLVYALRIKGATFRPKVFKKGPHSVVIGEGAAAKTLKGIWPVGPNEKRESIEVKF